MKKQSIVDYCAKQQILGNTRSLEQWSPSIDTQCIENLLLQKKKKLGGSSNKSVRMRYGEYIRTQLPPIKSSSSGAITKSSMDSNSYILLFGKNK